MDEYYIKKVIETEEAIDKILVEKGFKKENPDKVVHLAAQSLFCHSFF